MHIPLVDLKAQYQSIRAEVNAAEESMRNHSVLTTVGAKTVIKAAP